MRNIREELNECAAKYYDMDDLTNDEMIKISQEMDKQIVEDMRSINMKRGMSK
ncbi:aspartyl-phosphate phosphatase Spo0E family protein [Clostridium sp. YIM B02551]|uniref:aspartyl-phosphate phosphatase Spo0E family protein n=1 Tax=Clostridium sp. YIM B02551 TaxID=2910679 RepID=UPI001EEA039A|nr:aspartyl-phosphate phosphatase Spo0E family protein [Clostridium sp. YIM B02551]